VAPRLLSQPQTVTLRISLEENETRRCVRLHGRLTAAEVAELTDAARGDSRPLTIDVKALLWADGDGLAALRRLRDGGAELAGESPLIALLLAAEDEAGVAPARKETE
jgi:hypothetical protein